MPTIYKIAIHNECKLNTIVGMWGSREEGDAQQMTLPIRALIDTGRAHKSSYLFRLRPTLLRPATKHCITLLTWMNVTVQKPTI